MADQFPAYREADDADTTQRERGDNKGNNKGKVARPKTTPHGDGLRVVMKASKQHTARHLLKHPFVFQVPPLDSFSWSQEFTWSDYETIEKGTFSRPQSQGLRTVSFDTMFIDYEADFTLIESVWVRRKKKGKGRGRRNDDGVFGGPDDGRPVWPPKKKRKRVLWVPNPLLLTSELRRIMNSGTPFWLDVHQNKLWGRHDLEMLATLRSISVEERAGEVDARYVNVSFTEWREPTINRKSKGDKFPLNHKIKKGDTLKSLSKKYYGGYGGWKEIKRANKSKLKGVGPQEHLQNVKQHGKPLTSIKIPDKPDWMKGGKGKDGKGDGKDGGDHKK